MNENEELVSEDVLQQAEAEEKDRKSHTQIDRILSHRTKKVSRAKPKQMSLKEKKAIESRADLWNMGIIAWKLDSNQMDLYDSYYNRGNKSELTWVVGRQLGKCLWQDTKVPVIGKGLVKIKDLKAGDLVYGVTKSGKVRPAKVLSVQHQGSKKTIKSVYRSGELYHTPEHRFSCYTPEGKQYVNTLDHHSQQRIQKEFILRNVGSVINSNAFYHGQYQSFTDFEEMKNWDFVTIIQYLAGVIESCGSCIKAGNLKLRLYHLNQTNAELISKLFEHFFEIETPIKTSFDDYGTEYNYFVSINHAEIVHWLLKNTEHLLYGTKNYYPYLLKHFKVKNQEGFVSFKTTKKEYNRKVVSVWIDNETNLFLLENGIVNHNSFTAAVIAIEEAMNNPGISICYLAPTVKMARGIIRKNFVQILKDCPEGIQPKYNIQENEYTFPNGSVIKCFGTDNQAAEAIRGNTFDRIFVDESGFISEEDFDYIMTSIVYPTMTIATNPCLVYISTPPKKASHPFNEIIRKAMFNDTLLKRTIYDCPRLTKEAIQKIAERMGGETSSDFKREYLCQAVIDANSVVIPEATTELLEEITRPMIIPPFYVKYVSADWGVKDWTVVLFAYHDFRQDLIVIQDELIFKSASHTTEDISNAVKLKEEELWGNNSNPLRFCDNNNLQIINDLRRLHDLAFIATRKDQKEMAINEMRIQLGSKRIVISPKCKTLLFQLPNVSWNKQRTQFTRSVDGSHYDSVDAMIYLIRNINRKKNPYPDGFDLKEKDWTSPKQVDGNQSSFDHFLKKAFKRPQNKKPVW